MTRLKRHTVFPGQLVVTSVPTLISTVLGSCVSVCLWDKKSGIGGMNHFLLPGTSDDISNTNRGLSSTRLLICSMINRKVSLANVEAKIFGGSNSLFTNSNCFRVGEQNIAIAMEVLRDFNIPVSAQHVGGCYGRKIVFNTDTGRVRMRLLVKTTFEINEAIHKGFGY